MSIPFITKAANELELKKLQLLMSTFTDGSGYEKNSDGTTRPGWRDLERVIAELLHGHASEGKSIFDVLVQSIANPNTSYGVSVKSKGFSRNKFEALLNDGRVYMELCNSPAKLWEPLKQEGISELDFKEMRHANTIGSTILETVHNWYVNCGIDNIDLDKSVHLTISYRKEKSLEPVYQLHTFELDFPEGIQWKYKSARCLAGYDPIAPNEVLFDWYGLSGGQLKYYPKANLARFCSTQFQLIKADCISISQKAKLYWPDIWGQL